MPYANSKYGTSDGASDQAVADALMRIVRIMRRLRDPETGCPWDIKQTLKTIPPYTIEEAYEVADAIERDAIDELPDELGDLLLQVVFLSRIAEEDGLFTLADVGHAISDKMERRHPHIFGDTTADDADAVKANWETIKRAEKAKAGRSPSSLLDDVPVGLPGLMRAQKLQSRAARVGFDWPGVEGAIDKLREEVDEFAETPTSDGNALEDELGDVLFSAVNVARKAGLDADAALRRANEKFARRFKAMEAAGDLEALDLDAMERLWSEAKRADQSTVSK